MSIAGKDRFFPADMVRLAAEEAKGKLYLDIRTYIQYLYIQYIHTVHVRTYSTYIQYMYVHTVHTYSTCTYSTYIKISDATKSIASL